MKRFHTSISRRSRTAGFTLVEVLVSSFLTVMVLIMLFSVLMGTMNAWEGGTNRIQTNSDARLAMDLITRDLQSIVVRQTTTEQEWMVSMPETVNGEPSTWLTFFASSIDRDDGQVGDIVAVSYRTAYQDPISPGKSYSVPVFGLYKSMATTVDTFEEAFGQTNIIDDFWKGKESLNPVGFLVPNVIRFEVAWWVSYTDSGSGDRVKIRVGSEHTLRLSNVLSIDGTKDPTAKIESADILMTLLTDEGMRLYDTIQDKDRLIQEYGRTHTVRVPIHY